jgi:hypothetical protein
MGSAMRDHLFNVTQTAALLGVDVSVASRKASAGRFGTPVIHGGSKFYRLRAIERDTGKTFTPEQIAKAEAAHSYEGPPLVEVLRRFLAVMIERRDLQWLTALHEQNVKFKPPHFQTQTRKPTGCN